MDRCQCPPGVRSNACPYHRPHLLAPDELEFLLLVEDAYSSAQRPLPPMRESLKLFALAKKVVTEHIG